MAEILASTGLLISIHISLAKSSQNGVSLEALSTRIGMIIPGTNSRGQG